MIYNVSKHDTGITEHVTSITWGYYYRIQYFSSNYGNMDII